MKLKLPFHVAACALSFLCVGTVSNTAKSAFDPAIHGRPHSNDDWSSFTVAGAVYNNSGSTLTWMTPLDIDTTGSLTFQVNVASVAGATTSCRVIRFDEVNQLLVGGWVSTTSSTPVVLTLGTMNVPVGFGAYVECNLAPDGAAFYWVAW